MSVKFPDTLVGQDVFSDLLDRADALDQVSPIQFQKKAPITSVADRALHNSKMGAPVTQAEIGLRDALENTVLHIAAQKGDIAKLRSAIKVGADVNATNVFGETALHIAASSNNTQMVLELLRAGADIIAQDNLGQVPSAKETPATVETDDLDISEYTEITLEDSFHGLNESPSTRKSLAAKTYAIATGLKALFVAS